MQRFNVLTFSGEKEVDGYVEDVWGICQPIKDSWKIFHIPTRKSVTPLWFSLENAHKVVDYLIRELGKGYSGEFTEEDKRKVSPDRIMQLSDFKRS